MKKLYLFGWGLLFLILIMTILGAVNNSKVISKEKVEIIVSDYIKNNRLEIVDKETIADMIITEDFHSILTKSQQWIISINDTEDTWIFLDAYSGRIISTEKHYLDSFYLFPTDVSKFQKYFSWFLALNYCVVILGIFNLNRHKNIKVVLFISLIHLIGSILFFEKVSYLYMWIILIFVSIIEEIYNKIISIK